VNPARYWAALCACAAVFLFTQAGVVCCTPSQRAPIERDISSALTDKDLACLLGAHIPGLPTDVHAAVVAACALVGPAADAALVLLQAADAMQGKDRPQDAGSQ
jgi:hypothetical protein